MPSEVWVAVIAALGVLGGAVINNTLGARTMRREVREVHASTVNSHGTDLRQDVDKVKADLEDVLDAVRRIPKLETRLGEHVRSSALVIGRLNDRDRELGAHLTSLRELYEEQSSVIGNLADALPIVARSTPPAEDTTDPTHQ